MNSLSQLYSVSQYHEAMAHMPSSVSIVTTNGPGGKWGVTASAICSVSDSPPTVLVCLNRESRANAIIKKNMTLAVNVLGEKQRQMSSKFASKSADAVARELAVGEWQPEAEDEPPVLRGAAVNLVGKVDKSVEIASHTIFFVLVERLAVFGESKPIVYFRRKFHSIA